MNSTEINFEVPEVKLADFAKDKSITQDFYNWQLNKFLKLRESRGNVFYDKKLDVREWSPYFQEGQIIRELLGFLGAVCTQSAEHHTANYIVQHSFEFPLTEGYEEIWGSFHKPSYVPPTLLTTQELITYMDSLLRRGLGNDYAISQITKLKKLLGY
jgi:hypothetical protein